MKFNLYRVFGVIGICSALLVNGPAVAWAAPAEAAAESTAETALAEDAVQAAAAADTDQAAAAENAGQSVEAQSTEAQSTAENGVFAVVEENNTSIYSQDADNAMVVAEADAGDSYKVTGKSDNGWVKIEIGGSDGYVKPDGTVSLHSTGEVAKASDAAKEAAEEKSAEETSDLRQEVVNYALSFVGVGRYVYGGNDPHTGVDCSGFMRYVLANTAGVYMERSSASQANQGVAITADQMQPGDLLFYTRGGRIGHVAMYIGDGKVVHASNERNGIKVSDWNYRAPVKIISVLGEAS